MQKNLVCFIADVTHVIQLYNINVWNDFPEGHSVLRICPIENVHIRKEIWSL